MIRRIRRLKKLMLYITRFYGLDKSEIPGQSRRRHIVYARHMYNYIAFELGFTMDEIGQFIAKDRNTVRHGIEAIKDALDVSERAFYDKNVTADVEHLLKKCNKRRKIRRNN